MSKERPELVLLHAFPMSSEMWAPQRGALGEYSTMTPDFRGFGNAPLEAPWFIEHAADDVLKNAPKKAVYVGLSMGGYAAMRIAEKAPERVRALVLCDTRAEPDDNEGKAKRAAAVDAIRQKGMSVWAAGFLDGALAPKTLQENRRAVEFLRDMAANARPEAALAALAALAARPDAAPGLSKLRCPTAVLVGAQDKITPLPMAEAIRSRVPGAELHVIPDAGHFSNVENPAAFNERLLSFLKRL